MYVYELFCVKALRFLLKDTCWLKLVYLLPVSKHSTMQDKTNGGDKVNEGLAGWFLSHVNTPACGDLLVHTDTHTHTQNFQ